MRQYTQRITDNGSTSDAAVEVVTNSDTGVSAETAEGAYADGIYTGTGSGFRGDTTVTVTVSGGVIGDITVVSTADDKRYFSRAESSVIPSMISKQSVTVPTVSGATFSSNGIIEAVAKALSIDFTNPNSALPRHVH